MSFSFFFSRYFIFLSFFILLLPPPPSSSSSDFSHFIFSFLVLLLPCCLCACGVVKNKHWIFIFRCLRLQNHHFSTSWLAQANWTNHARFFPPLAQKINRKGISTMLVALLSTTTTSSENYKNWASHSKPSLNPCSFKILHMNTSIGRAPELPDDPDFPYVSRNPSTARNSSSEAACGMSILFPNTRIGTSLKLSSVISWSSSCFDSGKRSRSNASTMKTIPSTAVK